MTKCKLLSDSVEATLSKANSHPISLSLLKVTKFLVVEFHNRRVRLFVAAKSLENIQKKPGTLEDTNPQPFQYECSTTVQQQLPYSYLANRNEAIGAR